MNFCSSCKYWTPAENTGNGYGHCRFFEMNYGGLLPIWVDSRAFERKLIQESIGMACRAFEEEPETP